MTNYIFGWIATSLSITYKLPQIYKLYKTKESSAISIKSYGIQAFSYSFYIAHGFIVFDYPIAYMGIINLIQNIIIILLCHIYKKNELE
jgi:uncharacterized protein with PQ loop repeat